MGGGEKAPGVPQGEPVLRGWGLRAPKPRFTRNEKECVSSLVGEPCSPWPHQTRGLSGPLLRGGLGEGSDYALYFNLFFNYLGLSAPIPEEYSFSSREKEYSMRKSSQRGTPPLTSPS